MSNAPSTLRSRDRPSSNPVQIECKKCCSHFMGDADHQFCAICVGSVASELAAEQRSVSSKESSTGLTNEELTEINRLQCVEIERLRAALQWYADEVGTGGRLAREALFPETATLAPAARCSYLAQLSRPNVVGKERCVRMEGHDGGHAFNNNSYMEAKRNADGLRGESSSGETGGNAGG